MDAVAEPASGSRQLLTFHVAGEEYALDILRVREIVACGSLTQVPNVPRPVRGVMNLRGSVIPVVDLAGLFGLPPTSLRRRTCIVVVEAEVAGERSRLGILADAVGEVIDFPEDEIEPPAAFGTRAPSGALSGMGRKGDRFVLILHLDRVLAGLDPGAEEGAWSGAPAGRGGAGAVAEEGAR